MGLLGQHTWKFPVPQGLGVHHALNPNPYRGAWGNDGPKYAADVADLIQAATPGGWVGGWVDGDLADPEPAGVGWSGGARRNCAAVVVASPQTGNIAAAAAPHVAPHDPTRLSMLPPYRRAGGWLHTRDDPGRGRRGAAGRRLPARSVQGAEGRGNEGWGPGGPPGATCGRGWLPAGVSRPPATCSPTCPRLLCPLPAAGSSVGWLAGWPAGWRVRSPAMCTACLPIARAARPRPPPRPLTQTIREAGGVCIADEVQTGFGRTGSAYWGFQNQVGALHACEVYVGAPCGGCVVVRVAPRRGVGQPGRAAGAPVATLHRTPAHTTGVHPAFFPGRCAPPCAPSPAAPPSHPPPVPTAGRGARHRHPGQRHRQWAAAGGGGHNPRDRRRHGRTPALQHLRCARGAARGGAGRGGAGRRAGALHRGWHRLAGRGLLLPASNSLCCCCCCSDAPPCRCCCSLAAAAAASPAGGNPVSSAAGRAVLRVIDEEGLQENCAQVGGYLLDELRCVLGAGCAGIASIAGIAGRRRQARLRKKGMPWLPAAADDDDARPCVIVRVSDTEPAVLCGVPARLPRLPSACLSAAGGCRASTTSSATCGAGG